jgi:hypothetical protein
MAAPATRIAWNTNTGRAQWHLISTLPVGLLHTAGDAKKFHRVAQRVPPHGEGKDVRRSGKSELSGEVELVWMRQV